MTRLLIVPAAGAGSRLGSTLPKPLVPVLGRPMIEHLLRLHDRHVDRFVIVVQPTAHAAIADACQPWAGRLDVAEQPSPTGMLDAILIARQPIERVQPARVWITWCDQIAVAPATLEALARQDATDPDLLLPTVRRDTPYVHLERDVTGTITRILHRREGDAMPDAGETEIGLFSLARRTYMDDLPMFARMDQQGLLTRERNFVPFIAWLAARRRVVTFPATDPIESVGINTPEELKEIEDHLRRQR